MSAAVTIDRIIAKVNDEIITLSDLQDLAKPGVDNLRKNHEGAELNRRMRELELELLDILIENKLILQRAAALQVKVDEKEVENAIAVVLRENKITTAGLRNFLSTQGVTLEKYREDIRKRLLTRRVAGMEVGVRVTVGEQEIADYHSAHADDYREDEERTVRQIFFPLAKGAAPVEIEAQRKKAALAHARAMQPGADFAQVARERSEGAPPEAGADRWAR